MEVMDLAPAPALFAGRKRKAEAQDAHNERLSKRLSLLNLEKNGQKLYVPIENPTVRSPTSPPRRLAAPAPETAPEPAPAPACALMSSTSPVSEPFIAKDDSRHHPVAPAAQDAMMQLDDSKYKVYVYNIDDELSSDSESDEAKLVFLTDIEKHLRKSRVPMMPPATPPTPEGKELVLYSVPSSLSVPKEHDSVRKAIIDARSRARARTHVQNEPLSTTAAVGSAALASANIAGSLNTAPMNQPSVVTTPSVQSVGEGLPAALLSLTGDDCDAMDID